MSSLDRFGGSIVLITLTIGTDQKSLLAQPTRLPVLLSNNSVDSFRVSELLQ